LEYESMLNPLDRLWFTSSDLILGGSPMGEEPQAIRPRRIAIPGDLTAE
jgi:hypothetical protein